MAHLRFDRSSLAGAMRWTVGVVASSRCTRLEAALVGACQRGVAMRIEVAQHAHLPIPREITGLFRRLAGENASPADSVPSERIGLLQVELAELQAALVTELLGQAGFASTRVLAVGVHDPGLWSPAGAIPPHYLGLCDAARLAEWTGLNIIDAFPARDLACGGQGGPVGAVAEWMLLRDRRESRVLLDLGQTVRMTYLPGGDEPARMAQILAFDVGPGMGMLDQLTRKLTGGMQAFDPGGRLAVQGRCLDTLMNHWLADPYFERPLPRWHPRGVPPERFLAEALQMAVDHDWSIRDLLCTATHFIAETITRAIQKRIPDAEDVWQILVTGGGHLNGMLLREISMRLPKISLSRVQDSGIPPGALDAAIVASLALLHLEQIPSNPTAVTGTEVPRVLGRLTPGSPQNWQRLLSQLAGNTSTVRPLRSAV